MIEKKPLRKFLHWRFKILRCRACVIYVCVSLFLFSSMRNLLVQAKYFYRTSLIISFSFSWIRWLIETKVWEYYWEMMEKNLSSKKWFWLSLIVEYSEKYREFSRTCSCTNTCSNFLWIYCECHVKHFDILLTSSWNLTMLIILVSSFEINLNICINDKIFNTSTYIFQKSQK